MWKRDRQTDEERLPIEEVLPGVKIHAFEDGDIIDDVFVLAKLHDTSGRTGWGFRTSGAPNMEELLGALQVQQDLLRKTLVDEWDLD
jgi:hypothetical protein